MATGALMWPAVLRSRHERIESDPRSQQRDTNGNAEFPAHDGSHAGNDGATRKFGHTEIQIMQEESRQSPSSPPTGHVPYTAAFLCGLLVYLAIVIATGRNEAWDDSSYFVLGIPFMCVVAFMIANRYPVNAWVWVLVMAGGQMLGALLNGSSLSLLPFAIIFMAIISAPQFLAAFLGSRWAKGKHADARGKRGR
jgi:hypothetical protein